MANKETRKTISSVLGDKIKELRLSKDLSQAKLAEAVNADQSIIGLYERAKRLPSTDMVRKLAKVLNYNVEELLTIREYTIMETVAMLGDEAPKAIRNERNMIAHAYKSYKADDSIGNQDYEIHEKATVKITIDKDGKISADGKEMTIDEFSAYLKELSCSLKK